MDFKDYYSTLGVAKTATGKEIKQAFRKLARKHHPDVNPGDKSAEARFKEINEAHEVIGDPGKRRKYDELGANWRMYEQGAAGGGPGAGFPGGAWNVRTGGSPGGGFRTMSEDDVRGMFNEGDPFSDFFHTFFAGGMGPDAAAPGPRSRRRGAARGRDFEQEIQLGLEDAYQGATERVSIKHEGHSRTVDVRIPPGIGDGSRVRVAGEGEPGSDGAHSGDLYLRIRIAPDPRFERTGKDLHTHVAIPLTTAVLGGEVEIPTLAGKPLRLRIPATTQQAQVFRLKGHGMPAVGKPEERGDLYATVNVELPKHLTAEQRKHFEGLQKLETTRS